MDHYKIILPLILDEIGEDNEEVDIVDLLVLLLRGNNKEIYWYTEHHGNTSFLR